jgi:DNA replication protein DnaC
MKIDYLIPGKIPVIAAEKIKTGIPDNSFCKKHKEEYSEYDFKKFGCKSCLKEKKEKIIFMRRVKEMHIALNLPARFKNCSFDTFTGGSKKQHEIKKEIMNYVSNWPKVGGIIMRGGVGVGKTHLAAAMCSSLCDLGVSCMVTTASRIIRSVRASWGKNAEKTEAEIITTFASVEMLVIDEIGSQYGTDAEKIIINEIINDRYEQDRPTMVIGNVTKTEIKNILGVRVIDRIMHNGLDLVLDWDSKRNKGFIKKNKNG